ncbi:hypothetical protein [Thermococcus sp.]|uniref:hypothetical protein n=1 Tax=Thermococcus sp. TaxID=35749 RepID=UPI002623C1D6|nr:hypothetical protein [Thermococcus sp.]MCD6144133.1 hypothetical protein [Thermococcus sp.]
MYKKQIFGVIFVVFFLSAIVSATTNTDKSGNIEPTEVEDPIVCDYDSFSNGKAGVSLSVCGRASQSEPGWLYNINYRDNTWGDGGCSFATDPQTDPPGFPTRVFQGVSYYADAICTLRGYKKMIASIEWTPG